MSDFKPPGEDLSKVEFQMQKLYIKRLSDQKDPEALEHDLREYFSSFGVIIDLKTLRNRLFMRKK